MALTTIGRFKVGKRLGSGNQGTVYLCGDPELQRRVAIKLLDRGPMETGQGDGAFLGEARAMSRIQHPNIVSIYEAGRHQGTPYLVFEYVEGRLLSDLISAGELDVGRALDIFQGMLEGMERAHRQGIVHRDLKPANVIISNEGVPKIMDFGIARILKGSPEQDTQLIGSPRYMAPEYIEHGQVGTQADVFSLALILDEMLTGAPVFRGNNPAAVLNSILRDPVPAPSSLNRTLDERLDRLVLKALEKDPGARYADAGELLQAFKTYRDSLTQTPSAIPGGDKSTIEFLLRRMQRNNDFPTLAQSVRTLNALAETRDLHVHDLTQAIVKDFALTNKILKVVNSALYARFAGKVGTISRAVVVLGVQPIRSLAASLIFFDHLHDKAQAEELKELTSHALYSALVAGALAAEGGAGHCEDYFVSSMFHDLGRILVTYYLHDESREVERLIGQQGMAPVQAQRAVLGVSFEEMGIAIARHWNFPEPLIHSLRHLPPGGELKKPHAQEDWRRLVAGFAHAVTQQVSQGDLDDPDARQGLLKRFGAALSLDGKRLDRLVATATKEFLHLTKSLEMRGKEAEFLKRLRGVPDTETSAAPAATPAPVAQPIGGLTSGGPILEDPPAQTGDREALLTEGLQEVTQILLNQPGLPQLCNIVLETMYRAMTFRRVLLCLRDNGGKEMVAKLAFGAEAEGFAKGFRFPLAWRPDVFHAALKNGVDIYIANTRDDKFQADLPDWFKGLSDAGCFLLFPLVVKNAPLGLIYADHAQVDGLRITPKTLNLLRALRNQLVLGFRERL